MYHRFEENKYPSTNIKMSDFKIQLNLIKESGFTFVNPDDFKKDLENKKNSKKILLTIDDGFLSFYENAWPVLKSKKIPFILFVSTREVGKYGYMSWDQIKEIDKENFVHIGNHSHTHEYLVDRTPDEILNDLNKSILIFKKNLGYNSHFFSYPFGEYSIKFKEIVKDLNFKFAFGQHSGVIDETKDPLELPRFPINEKYGDFEFCGLHVHQDTKTYEVSLDQISYANSLSEVPVEKNREKDEKCSDKEVTLFRAVVGCLLWLAVNTRPDLCFMASFLASCVADLRVRHLLQANKVVHLAKTKSVTLHFRNLGLRIKSFVDWTLLRFLVFSDASFNVGDRKRSQGGHLIFISRDD